MLRRVAAAVSVAGAGSAAQVHSVAGCEGQNPQHSVPPPALTARVVGVARPPSVAEKDDASNGPVAAAVEGGPGLPASPCGGPWQRVQVVGGHDGMLSNGQVVLKPLQSGHRGRREADFYAAVAASTAAGPPPRSFMPAFHGVVRAGAGSDSAPAAACSGAPAAGTAWLQLDDITAGMREPCVLDLKLGCISWSPGSSARKRSKAVKRYPHQLVAGYRFTGMRVHRPGMELTGSSSAALQVPGAPASGEGSDLQVSAAGSGVVVHRRGFGRALHHADMARGWCEFLFDGRRLRLDLLPALAGRVGEVLAWFESQRQFHFFSSSLLIAYDAGDPTPASLRLCLIDFAHVQDAAPATAPGQVPALDTCTLVGLRNMAADLHRLQDAAARDALHFAPLPVHPAAPPLTPPS